MDNIKLEVLNNLFRGTTNLQAFEQLLRSLPQQLTRAEGLAGFGPAPQAAGQAAQVRGPAGSRPAPDGPAIELPIAKPALPKVGRNDPCPCGSGKKFKNCCGRTA
jgi:preprotein translocase subunit SecA